MDEPSNHKAMKTAIARLMGWQKDNLRFHLEHSTPIVCGSLANMYIDGKGGG